MATLAAATSLRPGDHLSQVLARHLGRALSLPWTVCGDLCWQILLTRLEAPVLVYKSCQAMTTAIRHVM